MATILNYFHIVSTKCALLSRTSFHCSFIKVICTFAKTNELIS